MTSQKDNFVELLNLNAFALSGLSAYWKRSFSIFLEEKGIAVFTVGQFSQFRGKFTGFGVRRYPS